METHFAEAVPISEVIERSHYSQRHFIRLFSSAYGMTPQRYLLDVRIRHATSMLRDSGLSVTEIAMRCGFGYRLFQPYFQKVRWKLPERIQRKQMK